LFAARGADILLINEGDSILVKKRP
jgi:hypothetical protein